MGKDEKLIRRLLSSPRDFTWDELIKVLAILGYEEKKKGKTDGSRRKFVDKDNRIINLHKPHPGNVIKSYAVNDVIDHLITNGKLKRDE